MDIWTCKTRFTIIEGVLFLNGKMFVGSAFLGVFQLDRMVRSEHDPSEGKSLIDSKSQT